jgi:hypothetical protein
MKIQKKININTISKHTILSIRNLLKFAKQLFKKQKRQNVKQFGKILKQKKATKRLPFNCQN